MIENRVYGKVKEVDIDTLRRCFEKIDFIKVALLFGSRARGDYNSKSDYDFAILAEGNFEWGIVSKAYVEISNKTEIDMEDMDIVDLKRAGSLIIDSIKEKYIVLKGKEDEVCRLLRKDKRDSNKRG